MVTRETSPFHLSRFLREHVIEGRDEIERGKVRPEKHHSAQPLRDRKNAQSRILSGQSCKLFLTAKDCLR